MVKFKLKEVLTSKQKSIYWLMQKTGKSFQSLANLTKKDLSGIHFDTLELLCSVLEVTPSDLIVSYDSIIKKIKNIDLNNTTYKKAFDILYNIQQNLKNIQ